MIARLKHPPTHDSTKEHREIFVIFYLPDVLRVNTGDTALNIFTSSPLWQSLSAVQAGNAYFVPGYWWRSQTYLLANKVIGDFTHLADTDAQTPVLELP